MCQNVTTDFLDRDYLEFMQYIGCKDIHDKDVYEGDRVIVNKLKNNYEVGDKVVMRYNDERTSFEVVAVDGDKVTLSNSVYDKVTVDKDDIIGEIIFRYYPLNAIGTIE